MADIEDVIEGAFKAGRKISGKAYRAYKKSQKSDKRTQAEIARERHIRGIRREARGRIGLMSGLPILAMIPIFTNIFGGNLLVVASAGGALACFAYGLFELRRGLALEAEELVAEAESEPLPTTVSGPHKLTGTGLIALGMAAFAYAGQQDWATVAGMAALTFAAGIFAVGFRGLLGRAEARTQPKIEPGVSDTPLGAALVAAHEKLHALYEAANQVPQENLRAQALGVHEAAQAVIDGLYEDVNDLSKARRFLVTYLDGAVKLVSGFAGQARRRVDQTLEDKFSDTLVTMEQTFVAQLRKLRADDAMDLDVQMDVLDAQMKGEGVN